MEVSRPLLSCEVVSASHAYKRSVESEAVADDIHSRLACTERGCFQFYLLLLLSVSCTLLCSASALSLLLFVPSHLNTVPHRDIQIVMT